MIISRTPYRISFFGGGTDYPAWFRNNGGAVLATTINRFCYITCRFMPPFFEHKSRIVWSKIELVFDHARIDHPVIRETLKLLEIDEGVEIHHNGDLPARSGLGSSSAFTVGLLHALHALRGERMSKSALADRAIYVEQEILRENVGIQDQVETAFGGLNRISINPDGSYHVEPLVVQPTRLRLLQDHLLLFYTGVSRTASEVAKDQIKAIPSRRRELTTMQGFVDQAIEVLSGSGELEDFGRLLHETWLLKRGLSDGIAPPFVDDIYQRARAAGAIGGKLLGAGGGGFMLFFVRPEDHVKVLSALSELLVVPIEFERQGSQIVMYEPVRYSRTAHRRRDFQRYQV